MHSFLFSFNETQNVAYVFLSIEVLKQIKYYKYNTGKISQDKILMDISLVNKSQMSIFHLTGDFTRKEIIKTIGIFIFMEISLEGKSIKIQSNFS